MSEVTASVQADAIRVVIVDDSHFVRRAFRRVLQKAVDIVLVGEADDGDRALELCEQLRPHVVLLDLQLPVRDGLSTLKEIRSRWPLISTVVVSASAKAGAQVTLAALELGALDFVDKSSVTKMHLHDLGAMLIEKIRAAHGRAGHPLDVMAPAAVPRGLPAPEVLVVGASTGGPQALLSMLAQLPATFPAAVVVIQHIPAAYLSALAARVGEESVLPTVVTSAHPIERGRLYFAAGPKDNVLVRRHGQLFLSQRDAPAHAPHVPSIDALFTSAAQSCGVRAWGALLTGMGSDGAQGLLAIRRAGGFTVAQDEATSVVFGMPRVATELGAVIATLPLQRIASFLADAAAGAAPDHFTQGSAGGP